MPFCSCAWLHVYLCLIASIVGFFSGPLNSRFSIHWNSNFHIFLCVCSLYFPAFLLHVNKTLVHSQEAHDVLICRVNKGTEPNVIKISSYVCLTCIDNVEIELYIQIQIKLGFLHPNMMKDHLLHNTTHHLQVKWRFKDSNFGSFGLKNYLFTVHIS